MVYEEAVRQMLQLGSGRRAMTFDENPTQKAGELEVRSREVSGKKV